MKKGFVVSIVGLAAVVSASACSAPAEEDSPETVGTATEALTEVYRREAELAFYIDAYLSGTRTVAPGWQYPQSDWRWLEAGGHSFGTMLANDYATSTCDRNLWLDYTVIHKY